MKQRDLNNCFKCQLLTFVLKDDVDVEPEEVKEPESTEDATRELLQFDQILSKSSESNTKKINSVASRNIHNVFVPFTQPSLPTESSESQSGGVVWDLLEVAKDTPPRYCIMFSTMDQSDRDKYSKIIEALGGKVSTLNYYDSSATHIVVVRPVRNEKLVIQTFISNFNYSTFEQWIMDHGSW